MSFRSIGVLADEVLRKAELAARASKSRSNLVTGEADCPAYMTPAKRERSGPSLTPVEQDASASTTPPARRQAERCAGAKMGGAPLQEEGESEAPDATRVHGGGRHSPASETGMKKARAGKARASAARDARRTAKLWEKGIAASLPRIGKCERMAIVPPMKATSPVAAMRSHLLTEWLMVVAGRDHSTSSGVRDVRYLRN